MGDVGNIRAMRWLRYALALALAVPCVAQAQRYDPWPSPVMKGSLVFAGGPEAVPVARARFVSMLKPAARVYFLGQGPVPKELLAVGAVAGVDAQPLADADAVWLEGPLPARVDWDGMLAAHARGAAVGGTVSLFQIGTRWALLEGRSVSTDGFLPGACGVWEPWMGARPGPPTDRVGIRVTPTATLVVEGRLVRVLGPGSVRFSFPEGPGGSARYETAYPGDVFDWIALRRRAVERSLAPFPPAVMPTPLVPQGTLVIVGGGGMPRGLLERFIELAGGPDAPIVFVPCESAETIPPPGFMRALAAAGAKNATWIHTKDRAVADTDPELLAKLRDARGIWFGGGRQWNFVDSYLGTEAERLMHAVLAKGGVIGGSSAGASIQSQYMPRGDPLGNTKIFAPGYERGFGFLPGCGVDQHFSQRNRKPDMLGLMQRYPQLLGIGLDEATALVVKGSRADVVGNGTAFFFDVPSRSPADDPLVTELKNGEAFDLALRKVLSVER